MISPPYSTITNILYNSDKVSESVSIDKDSDISTSTKISTEILPQTPKKVNNEGVAPITSSWQRPIAHFNDSKQDYINGYDSDSKLGSFFDTDLSVPLGDLLRYPPPTAGAMGIHLGVLQGM